MKSTDLLIQDHKLILRCLDVLENIAMNVQQGGHADAKDVEAILRFFRGFADNYHLAKEESALFPEMLRTAPPPGSPLHHILFQHDQARSLVEAIEEALLTQQAAEFVEFARRLLNLVRQHIETEENVLYDIAARSMTPEQDERIASDLSTFEMDPGYLADLRRLEWKYLNKTTACA